VLEYNLNKKRRINLEDLFIAQLINVSLKKENIYLDEIVVCPCPDGGSYQVFFKIKFDSLCGHKNLTHYSGIGYSAELPIDDFISRFIKRINHIPAEFDQAQNSPIGKAEFIQYLIIYKTRLHNRVFDLGGHGSRFMSYEYALEFKNLIDFMKNYHSLDFTAPSDKTFEELKRELFSVQSKLTQS